MSWMDLYFWVLFVFMLWAIAEKEWKYAIVFCFMLSVAHSNAHVQLWPYTQP